jgi:GLPGLI family protein
MDYVGNSNLIDEEDGEDGNVFLSIRLSSNPKIYKNLISKAIYNTERIGFKEFLVVDNFGVFNWVLTKNTKEILGFHCKEAKLNFRGRDYVAYYTIETQFNCGPWKFSGLPGTILEIESTDGVFKTHANSVNIKNGSSMIENPFKESDKFITWEDFIEKYRKKYYELQSYTNPDGGSMSIPKRKIEVLIED